MPEGVRLPYLVREVSEELKVSQKDVKLVIDTFFMIIAEELAEGAEVTISPYVKFKYRVSPPLKKGTLVWNPATGEKQPSPGRPAKLAVRATPLSGLKVSTPGPTTKIGKSLISEFDAAKKARAAAAAAAAKA
jgi:nucleoid DNA-binding protein